MQCKQTHLTKLVKVFSKTIFAFHKHQTYKYTDSINSVLSSLKSYSLWVTLLLGQARGPSAAARKG